MMGPGDPDCPHCHGRGVIPAPSANPSDRGHHPPRFKRCECVLQKDIAANVERAMRKLMQAPVIKTSPLLDKTEEDVWITAGKPWFMANLRHVGIRNPPTWYFKVVTDADLMTAWLASAALKGKEILDPDAAKVSLTYITLVDLVMPPHLLVIRLGVKQARNIASPEVLLEALRLREHAGLPTWLWDTPRERLAEGHICWSSMVAEYLSTWRHMRTQEAVMAAEPIRPRDMPGWQDAPEEPPEEPPEVDEEGEDIYEDKPYDGLDKQSTEEILKGSGGHVDLTLGNPRGRMTMSTGGGRKTLRGGGDK